MKSLLFILALCLIGISYAELPDTLKDPATREVAEYLDAKASTKQVRVYSITAAASGAARISCPAGYFATSGGCNSQVNYLVKNFPSVESDDSTAVVGTPVTTNGDVFKSWSCGNHAGGAITAFITCEKAR